MLPGELEALVRTVQRINAETQKVEVKAAHSGCPKKLYGTLSAFANQEGGGIIIFGLDEHNHFEAVGVYDAQDLEHQVNEQCKQMQPTVRPLFTVVETDGQVVVSAEIPEIDVAEKPCYYVGVGRIRGSYIRVGSSDEPMSEYEIYSYEAFRKRHQDDIRVTERAALADLDQTLLASFLHTLKLEKPNLAAIDDERIRDLLSITRDGIPTLAGVMMFSLFPQAYFPQFSVTAVVVPGYEIGELGDEGSRFLDNRRIEGRIPQMLDEALLFIKKNMSVRTVIDKDTGRRTDRTEYPLVAVREAVINALVHRDYSIHTEGAPVQIIFYKNRLEIVNPGGLYGRLTVSQLGQARADTRNPVLASMLEAAHLVENRYSGIPTMRRAMEEAWLPAPEFSSERGTFRVVFYNASSNKPMTFQPDENTGKNLLEFCAVPRSREEIAQFLGVRTTYYAVHRFVMPLVEKGLLAMTIPDKPRSRNQRFVSSHSP